MKTRPTRIPACGLRSRQERKSQHRHRWCHGHVPRSCLHGTSESQIAWSSHWRKTRKVIGRKCFHVSHWLLMMSCPGPWHFHLDPILMSYLDFLFWFCWIFTISLVSSVKFLFVSFCCGVISAALQVVHVLGVILSVLNFQQAFNFPFWLDGFRLLFWELVKCVIRSSAFCLEQIVVWVLQIFSPSGFCRILVNMWWSTNNKIS